MVAVNDVPQLVNKRGGSYVAIAPKQEPRKFNKWKKRMFCYLAGMEPYYLKWQSPLKVSHRPTPGYKTFINELDNDGVNLSKHEINVGFVNSLLEKWLTFSRGLRNANHTQTLDLADIYGRFVYEDNLIQRRYSDTKKALITTPSSTTISTAFISNNVIQDFQENSDDEVDERSSKEYLRDLDIEYQERSLLENSKRFIKIRNNFSGQKANENVECYKYGNKDYTVEYKKIKAKLALLEASPSISQIPKTFQPKNKGLVVETFNWDEGEVSNKEEVTQVKVLMALADDELTVGKSHARNGEWVDITIRKFVEEQRLNLLSKYNKMVFELNKCRDELLILKQAKLDAATFQIQNTELTKLNHALQEQLKEEKKINEKWLTSSKKVSQCISEQIPHQKKKVLAGELFTESSSKMNENENLCVPASMRELHQAQREDHRTLDHEMYSASLKRSENYKAQPYQYASSSKQILRAKAKPFPPSTHSGFNDHMPDDYRNYHEKCLHLLHMDLFRPVSPISINHEQGISQNFSSPYTPEQNGVAERKNRTLIEAARTMERIPNISYFYVFGCPVFIHNHNDHLGKFDAKADDGYFLGYSFVSKAFRVFNTRRQQVKETYHVTFDEIMEAIRQYQVDFDFSYYIILHGRSLTKLTQENHVPKVITPNEPDIPHTEDIEGPSDLINTEGTHEQNVQNDQMITQPTNIPSGNNTEVVGSITESLVPDVTQSHISNLASTSSHHVPQDRWLRDQHIELVSIIGDPGEGMIIRSMAAKLTAALASKCLCVDSLSEIEPQKEEGIDYDETFTPVARMEAVRIFLAFATYMNFKEEGIDYDETFTPVARMEAIRIFLAFATYINFKLDIPCFYHIHELQGLPNECQKLSKHQGHGYVLLVQVYVDDIIFGSTSYKLCKQFKKLMTKKFEISMMGELTYFLGLQIKQDDKGILIFQEQYTRNLLKKYEISDSSLVKTPMVPPNNLDPDLAGKPINEPHIWE
ncbi:retrovirus-related pol polyprotein from transposon TNT 1-94 [Tanacetum coccineum]